jgi:hypothetical protein
VVNKPCNRFEGALSNEHTYRVLLTCLCDISADHPQGMELYVSEPEQRSQLPNPEDVYALFHIYKSPLVTASCVTGFNMRSAQTVITVSGRKLSVLAIPFRSCALALQL